jgi:glycosyltransferase involved in cell wall biosynthesis
VSRIVSITPTAVERDSRTFKHAASLTRLGHTSIVLEGAPSALAGAQLPFELTSVGRAGRGAANGPEPTHPAPDGADAPRSRALRALRRILDLPITIAAQLRWNLRTYRALPDADLYYLHSYNQFLGTRLKARRRGAPLIYDAHDSYWEEDSSPDGGVHGGLSGRLLRAIERACVRRADRLTTVSGGVADLLEGRYGRRPEVIRNCPDLRLDRAAQSSLRSMIGAPRGAFVLVSVGNAKQGDTIEEALAAVTQLPADVHLAFVGGGYEHHRERARARGLGSRVHFLPAVAPTEVADFISTADASPILYRAYTANFLNALPNRFFHAIAAGLPLIYPPLVEITALAERYELGLPVDPTDPASVVEAVNALRDDPELVGRYRANAERAREELSWEREEVAIERLVAATLAERAEGG